MLAKLRPGKQLVVLGLRPEPVEDIQHCGRQEQAIASGVIGNDENSGIDQLQRRERLLRRRGRGCRG